MRRPLALVPTAALLPLLAGCAAPGASPSVPAASPRESRTACAAPADETSTEIVGRVLRFASADAAVDVTVREDDPAVRDLLSRLPLELTAEEFAGKEKIVRIPGGLETAGSPGSDPEDGDLIYSVPWGDVGLDYDASGIGRSDDTIHIGTFDPSRQRLDALEGPVRVTSVR